MRKRFREILKEYIENTNKSIFDLDINYLKENGHPNIKEIKEQEKTKIFEDPFYVYNKCLKVSPKVNQRFVISYEIKQQRGNTIELTILDNNTNKEYKEIFEWYPLITEKGYSVPFKVVQWVNNILVDLNRV